MEFLKVRKGESNEEVTIKVDVSRNHKRPLMFRYTLLVKDLKFHSCYRCVYNASCGHMCKILENSAGIKKFVKENFGDHEYISLVPIKKEDY